jgi:23S rRNA (adenine2503-C2)-methyltransferase
VLTDIKSLTREELEIQFKNWEQPIYRVAQLLDWLYVRRVTTWDAMTNLPKTLREKLRENFSLQTLELVRKQGSHDTTQKFLWRLHDHSLIESVLIPANPALYGEASDRHTLCISTQVGCAYGCKFCASGLDGWKRNLMPNEIVEQILSVERWHVAQPKEKSLEPTENRVVNNIVVMGMGEPLANYDNLLKALKIRHWRAQNHNLNERSRAANPQTRRRADAIPPRHFPARRDRRNAQQNHAGQS